MTQPVATKDMLGRTGLRQVAEVLRLIQETLSGITTESESIELDQALDRVLAEPIHSDENLPPRPRSVMDGFAVKATDTFGASESIPCYLQITGSVAMGQMPAEKLTSGGCFRIATGGFLPEGADAVIMLEHTIAVDDTMVEIVKGVGSGTNIIDTGEDIAKGQEALPAGHVLRPQDLGLLAGLGIKRINVYRRVKVGILATGDEIVPYTDEIEPGQIRNINSIVLDGLIRRCGGTTVDLGIISDNKEMFYSTMEAAVNSHDIVIFSGGSSVGVRDLGEQIVDELGPPGILVHGVALKPGKPVLIGMSGSTPVFGLPGHPVSAMVCFELFVKPAIALLCGQSKAGTVPQATVTARLGRNINSAAGRRDLVRVHLEENKGYLVADPVMGKSGAISTLSRAHGYFVISEESQGITEGTDIEVIIYQ